ncbi:hypothetical protein DMC30DRAFT_348481 [Rhodotorula diobovata]|uniref:Peroxisomal membrane protein n=1 Tax=Rhodotorula diobovata TaxID=5288 RepID=A0A5C5G2X4_9BASI|nr:hypothetical protein DMC30DRAFT_348481 [Rhodotorula diobovata]
MATTDPTLVLQDLLSPPSPAVPPATLAQLVALHLGSVPLTSPHLPLIALLVQYSLQSPALWGAVDPAHAWDRHRLAYDAARQGVLLRLDSLARPPSGQQGASGWSTRRAVHTFLREVYAGLWADPTSTSPGDGGVDPLVRLTLASGVLAALQEWKRRKEKLWVGGASGLERAEKETGRAWTESNDARRAVPRAAELEGFPAWLAAQTVPFVRAEELAADWNAPALLACLTDAFSSVFDRGYAFANPPLATDLSQTADGLDWAVPSPSHTYLSSLVQRTLFVSLGPLSRALGRSLEATALASRSRSTSTAAAQSALSAIHDLSSALLAVASTLSRDWARAPWSDHTSEESLTPATRTHGTAPWTLLKSLLFAQTLVYSSLLDVVSSTPGSSPDTPPTGLQRQLASTAVQALARTYFVALQFGQGGFEAWRAVLAGLVESTTAVAVSPAEALVRSLEPARAGPHKRAVERAEATFWLNTAEQVMRALGDEYVERVVLKGCRPYLDDAAFRDSFEAAHSVVLAVFSTGKRCVCDVAPWYIDLLLRIYPSLLSPTQLRVGYATTVAAVTAAGDDALAWWCVEELLARIDALPVSTPQATPAPSASAIPLRDLSEDVPGAPPTPIAAVPSAAPAPAPEDDAAVTPREQRVLSSLPRGAHLLVLVSLLPSLSLSLLSLALSALEARVRLEPPPPGPSPGSDGRAALVEECFAVLGTGMDAAKRAEGVRWWLERGRDLLVGGPIQEEEEAKEDVKVGLEGQVEQDGGEERPAGLDAKL